MKLLSVFVVILFVATIVTRIGAHESGGGTRVRRGGPDDDLKKKLSEKFGKEQPKGTDGNKSGKINNPPTEKLSPYFSRTQPEGVYDPRQPIRSKGGAPRGKEGRGGS